MGYEEDLKIKHKRKFIYNTSDSETENKIVKHNDNITSNMEKENNKKMDEGNKPTNETKEQPTRAEHKYIHSDKGPFYVLVNSKTPQNMMSLIIARVFNENNTKIKNIIEVNKKLARVEFDSYEKANKCVRTDDPIQKILTTKGYNCYIPKTYTHVEGVIRGLAGEFSMDEIKKNLRCEYPITLIETIQTWDRDNKKLKDTNIIKIELRANELPRQMLFYGVKVSTGIFIPKIRFCSACLSYGHIRKFCRTEIKRCSKCAKPIEPVTEDKQEPHKCQEKPECKFCPGIEHYTNSKKCPEKKKQTQIKIHIIKYKTTYREATEALYPRQKVYNNQRDIQNYPIINKNHDTTPNAWIERANRNEGIIKEQRMIIEQLQVAVSEIVKISNKNYTVPDLLIIDLKNAVQNLKIN